MAASSPVVGRNSLSLLLLAVLLLAVVLMSLLRPTTAADAELIDEVCQGVSDKIFCRNVLNSDPRTPAADLHGLGLISIELWTRNAAMTHKYIEDLLSGERCDGRKSKLLNCAGMYDYVLRRAGNCTLWLEEKKYKEMREAATAGQYDAEKCEQAYAEDPCQTSPLTLRNDDVGSLADLVWSVAINLELSHN